MTELKHCEATARYAAVQKEKIDGETYTPKILSDFVARNMVEALDDFPVDRPLRILDPALGDGVLLSSLLEEITVRKPGLNIEAYGFETNSKALNIVHTHVEQRFLNVTKRFELESFLEFVLKRLVANRNNSLFDPDFPETYDLIIANPPYVRTQIIGSRQAQLLAKQFGLSGRIDLYYAFILAIAEVLEPRGVAGLIVSNRFMTTRSGTSIRRTFFERYNLRHIWDLGDTKLFGTAILPAVLVAEGKNGHTYELPTFTSIYETAQSPEEETATPIQALQHTGVVKIEDGRRFLVQHGKLDADSTNESVWRIATEKVNSWLATVETHTWGMFGDIGRIRVGVKTCADKVFIRSDWDALPDVKYPELLRPLITHHSARRFKALVPDHPRQILYPHERIQGHRHAVDLSSYPRSRAYLEDHRATLESRKYVIEAGRKWYEIWVPQEPEAWRQPKLVFRDIAEKPIFWVDLSGSVVNGDCYWIVCRNLAQVDLLWLAAAVANSRFIECFYDARFNNKLYAGRRRYITQYVEKFPLPDPHSSSGKAIIAKAKEVYTCIPSAESEVLQKELEQMIWRAFGLAVEEVPG